MQDTLYLKRAVVAAGRARATGKPQPRENAKPATLLRTHTSAMQIRYMETHEPPVRIIAPGRVYRRDNLDLTHTPMFQQVEGLVVGEGVTMADLKGTIIGFLRELFTPTRPSSSVPASSPTPSRAPTCSSAASSARAAAARCASAPASSRSSAAAWSIPRCSRPSATTRCAITGFAFGVGIERLALLMHGVEDIRLFYENDLRFLEQFPL